MTEPVTATAYSESPPVRCTQVGLCRPLPPVSKRAAESQSRSGEEARPVAATTKYDPSGENFTCRRYVSKPFMHAGLYASVYQLLSTAVGPDTSNMASCVRSY